MPWNINPPARNMSSGCTHWYQNLENTPPWNIEQILWLEVRTKLSMNKVCNMIFEPLTVMLSCNYSYKPDFCRFRHRCISLCLNLDTKFRACLLPWNIGILNHMIQPTHVNVNASWHLKHYAAGGSDLSRGAILYSIQIVFWLTWRWFLNFCY